MSSELARKEGQPLVPGTPNIASETRTELLRLINHYDPVSKLEAYSNALNYIDNSGTNDHFFILHLKPRDNRLVVSSFKKSQSQQASDHYLSIERAIQSDTDEEAVLVSVDSVSSLKRAYPNYFLDTKLFASEVMRSARLAKR